MADTPYSTILIITHGEPGPEKPDELSQNKTSRGESFVAELVKAEFAKLPFGGIMYATTPLCQATVAAFVRNSANDFLAGKGKIISEREELYSSRSDEWKRLTEQGNPKTIFGLKEMESNFRAGGGVLEENFILGEGERIFRFLEKVAKTLKGGDTFLCITARVLLGAVVLWLWENQVHPLFHLHKSKSFEEWEFPSWMVGALLFFQEGEFERLIYKDLEELLQKKRKEEAAISDISRLFRK